jgi:predicted DCC family thiol-disulfide oxidoreductase YuxK
MAEMRLLTREGQMLSGADALVYLATAIPASGRPWWAWLLAIASKMPFAMPILRAAYRWIAARRHCAAGRCTRAKFPITKEEGIQ